MGPSYPHLPYRFVNREYMIITYETDKDLLRQIVPEPLEPNPDGHVLYEWIRMPDSSGFGDYTESGLVIPCLFQGEPINFTAQMYLDDEPPISAGREIWGFPKKYALPKIEVCSDTYRPRGAAVEDRTMSFGCMNCEPSGAGVPSISDMSVANRNVPCDSKSMRTVVRGGL